MVFAFGFGLEVEEGTGLGMCDGDVLSLLENMRFFWWDVGFAAKPGVLSCDEEGGMSRGLVARDVG